MTGGAPEVHGRFGNGFMSPRHAAYSGFYLLKFANQFCLIVNALGDAGADMRAGRKSPWVTLILFRYQCPAPIFPPTAAHSKTRVIQRRAGAVCAAVGN
jgi:hypothetical protein